MKIKISEYLAAIKRNLKMIALVILMTANSYASYQHGKYVGSLGGSLDTAGLEKLVATLAEPAPIQVADAGFLTMPPTVDEMNSRDREEAKNYKINRRK